MQWRCLKSLVSAQVSLLAELTECTSVAGVFDASEPSSKTNFLYHAAISHRYDTRSWLGQPVNSGLFMSDLLSNDIERTTACLALNI